MTDDQKNHISDSQNTETPDDQAVSGNQAPDGQSPDSQISESPAAGSPKSGHKPKGKKTADTKKTDAEAQAAKTAPAKTEIEEPKRQAPDNAHWYVVHTYSGHENKVAATLKQRIETMKLEEKIFDIVVPTRNIVTVRHGKKEEQKEKIFPGYILVKMVLDDISWLAVRTTQGVTAFVGTGNKPTPISETEVATILKFMQQEAPKYKTTFSVGEAVKIVDGPFSDFLGTVDSLDEEKGKVKVLVSIFGRETPVELDFLQVAKL